MDLELINMELRPLVEGTAELVAERARAKGLALMTYVTVIYPATCKAIRRASGKSCLIC